MDSTRTTRDGKVLPKYAILPKKAIEMLPERGNVVLLKRNPQKKSLQKKTLQKKKDNHSPQSVTSQLAILLFHLIKERDPKFKEPRFMGKGGWDDEIGKIIRLDGRTEEEVESVIRWCQKDAFLAEQHSIPRNPSQANSVSSFFR